MKNKVGVITSTYANFDTEEALEGISKTGVKYVELITVPGFLEHISLKPEDADDTLDICKKYGVELYAIAGHGRMLKENSVKSFKEVIDAASLLGVDYVDTDTGEIKDDNDKNIFYKDIKVLGEYAAGKGVTIGIETHGNWCNNGKIASEVIKKINNPNVKITYDPANSIFYGDTRPEGDIKYAIHFLGHLHVKDKRGGKGVWDFPVLGEGELDFDKIFSLLKNFEGPMTLEIELDGKKNPINEVNDAVRRSYEFIKSYGLA